MHGKKFNIVPRVLLQADLSVGIVFHTECNTDKSERAVLAYLKSWCGQWQTLNRKTTKKRDVRLCLGECFEVFHSKIKY
jgi:hypothetical protein